MVSLEQRYKAASRCVCVWPQVTPDLEKKKWPHVLLTMCVEAAIVPIILCYCVFMNDTTSLSTHSCPSTLILSTGAFRFHFPSFSNHHSLQLHCFVRSGSRVTMATDKQKTCSRAVYMSGRKTSCKKTLFDLLQNSLAIFFLYVTQKLEHKKLPAGCPWFAKNLRTSWAEFYWDF